MKTRKRFHDRAHAGAILARKFRRYKNAMETIVVGLARGGAPVAIAVSDELNLPCDVLLCRKIGTPEDSQCALGAITETGTVFLDEEVLAKEPWIPSELRRWIEHEIQAEEKDVARRRASYRTRGAVPAVHNKSVLIVDDGAYTAAAFAAAIQSLRALGASRIVGGLPIAPPDVIAQIRPLTDELVVLLTPERVVDLKDYYDDLSELKDEEIVTWLQAHQRAPTHNGDGQHSAA